MLMVSEAVVTDQEEDLGVVVDCSMKLWTQCVTAMKKVNFLLGIIRNDSENNTATLIMLLNKYSGTSG